MPEQMTHIHPAPAEQAPHVDAWQSEQVIEAYQEGMRAIEHVDTSRVTDEVAGLHGQAIPAVEPAPPSDACDDIDPEMTIAWGEDPGWLHARPVGSGADEEGRRS